MIDCNRIMFDYNCKMFDYNCKMIDCNRIMFDYNCIMFDYNRKMFDYFDNRCDCLRVLCVTDDKAESAWTDNKFGTSTEW